MDWPQYLPDLNPIEDLWAISKSKIYEQYPELLEADNGDATRERLIEAAVEMQNNLEDELLTTLSDTMPNHVDAIREVQGWYTKYSILSLTKYFPHPDCTLPQCD